MVITIVRIKGERSSYAVVSYLVGHTRCYVTTCRRVVDRQQSSVVTAPATFVRMVDVSISSHRPHSLTHRHVRAPKPAKDSSSIVKILFPSRYLFQRYNNAWPFSEQGATMKNVQPQGCAGHTALGHASYA